MRTITGLLGRGTREAPESTPDLDELESEPSVHLLETTVNVSSLSQSDAVSTVSERLLARLEACDASQLAIAGDLKVISGERDVVLLSLHVIQEGVVIN